MDQTLPRSKRYFKIFKKSVKSWGKKDRNISSFSHDEWLGKKADGFWGA